MFVFGLNLGLKRVGCLGAVFLLMYTETSSKGKKGKKLLVFYFTVDFA